MSGIVPAGTSREACTETLIANLKRAAPKAAARGKTLIIEPINTRDIPGYFLNTPAQARAVLEAVAADNVGLQFDFYHVQIVEGDLAKTFEKHMDIIRHVQMAGVQAPHEQRVVEINVPYPFDLMSRTAEQCGVACQ